MVKCNKLTKHLKPRVSCSKGYKEKCSRLKTANEKDNCKKGGQYFDVIIDFLKMQDLK